MTGGGGRCQKRRRGMAGGRGTVETKKIDGNCNSPNSESEITQKPSGSLEITGLPPAPSFEFDCYTQARKALSFRSPFDYEESQVPPASSGANTLPSGVSHLLGRHSDSRKRHKKSHSGSEKKSSTAGRSRVSNIWVETEEYFRELNVEDVDRLEKVSGIGFSGDEKYFLIPSLDNDGDLHTRYDSFNRKLALTCQKDRLNLDNGVGLDINGKASVKEMAWQEENEPRVMDVDGGEGAENCFELDKESREKGEYVKKDFTSFSGIEWLLGSRSKIYLASERPSKRRKSVERSAGFEKLHVARPVEGIDSVCHYCSYGETGDPLNCLIQCGSCGMVVHQRCYGVRDDVNPSWLCSWCRLKSVMAISDPPCLLCPKSGGALKPVQKRGRAIKNKGFEVDFAHLFCSQWMPEFYIEDCSTMEPIMVVEDVKDTKKKLNCYLCKVKCGSCVRCSNGACRNSFHPICAREARNRMEIWGKLGCDEVELRAFCSKHSEVQYESISKIAGGISLTDENLNMLKSGVLDRKNVQNNGLHSQSHPESGDVQPSDEETLSRNDKQDFSACDAPSGILKKLIDMGKVHAKELASDIGVSPDSLKTVLDDNHIVPELQSKLLNWLKSHTHLGSVQKNLNWKIRQSVVPKSDAHMVEGVCKDRIESSEIQDAVPVKSVPPRRRTKSNIKILKDNKSCSSKDNNDETTDGSLDLCLLGGENLNRASREFFVDVTQKTRDGLQRHHNNLQHDSLRFEDEMSGALAQCVSEDGQTVESKQSERMGSLSLVPINGEAISKSYVHPFIFSKLIQTKDEMLDKAAYQSTSFTGRESSQFEASSSAGLCYNHDSKAMSGDLISRCNEVNLDQLAKAENMDILKLSPADEVEGELIYYQQRIISNTLARKQMSDHLISKVIRSLPQEIDDVGKRKWDAVLVSQYHHVLKEAKKQGRKERRHKEAQAVLAAATAAAAASSRISSLRKDTPEDSAFPEDLLKINVSDVKPGVNTHSDPRFKETICRSAVGRPSFDASSTLSQLSVGVSKEHPKTCEVCRRAETILNPILVCSSCKVAVHLDCYRGVKSTKGPWHCELCEDLFSSQGSGALASNSWEKPYFVAECALCGGTASAFRKSVNGQWIHAFCAEWLLEPTYRRGQVNPIEGMDTVSKGIDACTVCHRKQGACLKCSYGHCQSTFHPTCARSAGFFMTVRTSGGKLQHKAYCEKHSSEQKAKADNQKHGIEEFKSLKQVRVELERLRLLCERIVKREKLKRELVLCSHDILTSSRDSILSALARHPFYQPEISSESATTSIKGYTDGCKSGSETVQRSDDITVDSTVAGKTRMKIPIPMDNDQKTDDSSSSQNLYTLQPIERAAFSGKKIPQRLSVTSRNLSEDAEKRARYRKPTETFEKELLMTSDQASMKNQRLPKGFVYVPVRCLSKKEEAVPDACFSEPVDRNG